MNAENLRKGKEVYKEYYENRFNKDTICKCICIAEEYGRIATLEEEVGSEAEDYDFVEGQFNALYKNEKFKIQNWEALDKAYAKFLEDYYY